MVTENKKGHRGFMAGYCHESSIFHERYSMLFRHVFYCAMRTTKLAGGANYAREN